MKNKIRLLTLLLLSSIQVFSQKDSVKYDISLTGVISNGVNSPFLIHSNQYGTISNAPKSSDLMVGIDKEFNNSHHLLNYGFKANLLIQTDRDKSNVYFNELFVKAHLLVFDLVIGEREEHLGNQDSTLSSGGFLFSQNARPMPKITIGIEKFTPVPFTKGYLEVKGALTHGWFTDNTYVSNLFLHHKYLYAKIGGRLPVHFQYGIDHVAQWGGIVPGYGKQPSGFRDFIDIFLGKSGGKNAIITDQINALGNHIISQSMRLDVDISDFKVSGYWQNISEDGPITFITSSINKTDGLWGISLRNSHFPFIKGILYEYLNTTDQSGPYHDKDGIIYGGDDNYFYNGVYQTGWSYYSRTIGTPYIFPPTLDKSNGSYFPTNNRVQVHHIGIEGDVAGYAYKFLTSVSKNYGTYSIPFPVMAQNIAMMFEINKQFPKLSNIQLGFSIGSDVGKLYGNSTGCMLSIKKTGDLFNY